MKYTLNNKCSITVKEGNSKKIFLAMSSETFRVGVEVDTDLDESILEIKDNYVLVFSRDNIVEEFNGFTTNMRGGKNVCTS